MDLTGIPQNKRPQVKQDIGELIVEKVLSSVAAAKSPVVGEDWPKLNKEYKAKKVSEGFSGKADLEESGDMLNALATKNTRGDNIKVGFFGSQALKADGHLKFSGKQNHTPQRRALPAVDQQFNEDIEQDIDKIIQDAKSSNFDENQLKDITTKEQLYDYLGELFGDDESRHDLRLAALRSEEISQALADNDLMDLL